MSEINIDYINEQLDLLDDTKSQIKQAIIDKGQDIEDSDTFNSFAEKIAEIQTKRNTADVPIWSIYTGIGTIDDTVLNVITNETEIPYHIWVALSRIDDFNTSRDYSQPLVGDYCVIGNVQFSGSENKYFILGYFSSVDTQYVASGYLDGNIVIIDAINSTKFGPAQAIQSWKIAAGTSVLGIEGTFTSDANAGNYDIISGKTAYTNGRKQIGNMKDVMDLTVTNQAAISIDLSNYGDENDSYIGLGLNQLILNQYNVDKYYLAYHQGYPLPLAHITNAEVLGADNLLPENIKEGVKVLGVTGTLQGGPISQEDYDECLDIANNILGE